MNILNSRHSSNDRLTDGEKTTSEKERNKEKPQKKFIEQQTSVKSPFKDVLTEEELQVKIADLGNACWTVRIINIMKLNNISSFNMFNVFRITILLKIFKQDNTGLLKSSSVPSMTRQPIFGPWHVWLLSWLLETICSSHIRERTIQGMKTT